LLGGSFGAVEREGPTDFPFDRTITIAHRGAHDESHAENSPAAFQRALDLGFEGVELDACNLADGSFVVRHDGWLELGDERVPIPTLAPDDPRVVAAGLQPLEPILEILGGSNVLVVFDWKGLGAEDRAAASLARHGLSRRTVVSTSVAEALTLFREADAALTTGLTVPNLSRRLPPPPLVPALARRHRCQAVMLEKDFLSPGMAAAIRDSGLGLFLWTAQSSAELHELRRYEPDGIMTDAV
jgi:glycerophosphoryl diester phosphodiesterase